MWYGEGFDRKKIYTIDYDCMDALSQEIAREQAQESMRQAEEQGRKVVFVTVPLKPKAGDELPEDVKDAREEPPEEALLQDEISEYANQAMRKIILTISPQIIKLTASD